MLGPSQRPHAIDQARQRRDPFRLDRCCGAKAQTKAVEHHRDLRREGSQGANLALRGVKKIIGDHFNEIQAVQMADNSRCQLRTPTQADLIPQ